MCANLPKSPRSTDGLGHTPRMGLSKRANGRRMPRPPAASVAARSLARRFIRMRRRRVASLLGQAFIPESDRGALTIFPDTPPSEPKNLTPKCISTDRSRQNLGRPHCLIPIPDLTCRRPPPICSNSNTQGGCNGLRRAPGGGGLPPARVGPREAAGHRRRGSFELRGRLGTGESRGRLTHSSSVGWR